MNTALQIASWRKPVISGLVLGIFLVGALALPPTVFARKKKKKRPELELHEVEPGDSLYRIAAENGCSLEELLDANPEKKEKPDQVFPGEKINIPHCKGPKKNTRVRSKVSRRGRRLACDWSDGDINKRTLKPLMKKYGFKKPKKFRAMVVKVTLNKPRKKIGDEPGEKLGEKIVKFEIFDYDGKAASARGWNPASTIKLFSGIAALERMFSLGFSEKVEVTFHYPRKDQTFTLEKLFEEAVHMSKNLAHNRLVQLASHRYLNGKKGPLRRLGLKQSYIRLAYQMSDWKAEGHSKSLAYSPPITLLERHPSTRKIIRKKRLDAEKDKVRYPCWGAACTSLSDLSKMMCTVMLHEQLPKDKRLNFRSDDAQGKDLEFLRKKLNRKRDRRKDPVWKIFKKYFNPAENPKKGDNQLFRKSGYAREWMSDNIYIYQPSENRRIRWIVTMAGYPGRKTLVSAAEALSQIIKNGDL